MHLPGQILLFAPKLLAHEEAGPAAPHVSPPIDLVASTPRTAGARGAVESLQPTVPTPQADLENHERSRTFRGIPSAPIGRGLRLIAAGAFALLAGCSGDDPTSPPPPLNVSVTPAQEVIAAGDTVRLAAVVTDTTGAPSDVDPRWSSDDPLVAMVDANGLVSGVGEGEVRIVARAGADSASALIRVTPAVATIAIGTAVDSLVPGTAFRIALQLSDANGAAIPDLPVRWSVSDTSVARVDDTGLLTVRWVGDAVVTARAGGREAQLPIRGRLVRQGTAGMWSALDHGTRYACALTEDGEPWCWGTDFDGHLGQRGTSFVARRVEGTNRFVSIHAGGTHTCALAADSTAWCWGRGHHGQLGTMSRAINSTITPIQQAGAPRWAWITTGGHGGNCGLRPADSTLVCWGHNDLRQLGLPVRERSLPDGSVTFTDIFTPLIGYGGMKAKAASVDDRHGCMLTLEGEAWCSGEAASFSGVAGDPASSDSVPWRVVGGHRFSQISTGSWLTCAISLADQLLCWGTAWFSLDMDEPTVVMPGTTFDSVRTGEDSSGCARTTAGEWMCWGRGIDGAFSEQLQRVPPPAAGESWRTIEHSGFFVCGLTTAGSVYCWGPDYANPPAQALRARVGIPMAVP